MSSPRNNPTVPISQLLSEFPSEGFTPIPHDLLDWIAPVLTEAELRVLLYIARRTYGFGKKSDRISLFQFCFGPTSRRGAALDLGTGLSRQGVLNAINGLRGKGLLKVSLGRGRSQVTQFEIHLSAEALERIETLKIIPREKVKSLDPLRKQRKGQSPAGQKVNVDQEFHSQRVHEVDPQNKVNKQEKVRQQEIGLASKNTLSSTPLKNQQNADDLQQKLERITGQRLTNSQTRKLQAISHDARVAEVMDTLSTESYWIESPRKNEVFLQHLRNALAERWSAQDLDDW